MPDHAGSFVELLAAAKSGEPRAIDQLVERFSANVRHQVSSYRTNQNGELSERDLCQLTWIRVLRFLPRFEGDNDDRVCHAKFRAWLSAMVRTIVLNEIHRVNAVKRGKAKQSRGVETATLPSEERTPSSIVAQDEELADIRKKLAALCDPLQIEVLKLRFYGGLKIKEIANELDLTPDQVRHQISKALKSLKFSFADEIPKQAE